MRRHIQILLAMFFTGCLFLYSCRHYMPENRQWFTCSITIDTTTVIKDWNRGAYLIQDSLILSASLYPFDTGFCNTIELRIAPIISFHGKHICSIGDLYPPFKIYKPTKSDTLIVIKDDQEIYFQIPDYICKKRYRTKMKD